MQDSDLKNIPNLLSIVLTSHNYTHFLPFAIEAILNQSLKLNEFIIIDDASSDNSVKIIKKYSQSNPIIQLVQNKSNQGIVSCLNQGLKLASGRYLIYTAADDIVLSNFFEKSISFLEQYPQAAFCSALADMIDAKGKSHGRWPSPIVTRKGFIAPQDATNLLKKYGFWLMGSTAAFRRQILMNEGGFPPELGPIADSFICQVMALRYGACFIPEKLVHWRRIDTGYAVSTFSDAQRSLVFINQTEQSMRTKYNGLFPLNYIKRWKHEQIYDLINIAGHRILKYHDHYINDLKLILADASAIDRIMLLFLKNTIFLRIFFLKFYMLIRFRPLTWRQIMPRIIYNLKNLTHLFYRT
jgi:glycosyltransferase involved in cell wall biosynthesis